MNATFESLPEEKRKKIIDISMEEFAQNGYEKASTNAIVKKAGISKGILFHYFGNKKNLYLYIVDYGIDCILKHFYNDNTEMPTDIFEKLMAWSLKKLKVYYDLPVVSKVIMNAFTDIPDELREEMMERQQKIYKQNMPLLLKDIDTTRFRKGVDSNKAIELILMCLEGVNNKYLKLYKGEADKAISQMDKILDEMREYLEILKGGIYDNSK
ncbi:MAG: TetR/AcrR family transcriptional regulator [Bacillota bacterium]